MIFRGINAGPWVLLEGMGPPAVHPFTRPWLFGIDIGPPGSIFSIWERDRASRAHEIVSED